jgi:hypothetical protein
VYGRLEASRGETFPLDESPIHLADESSPKGPDHEDGAVTTYVREARSTFAIAQDQLAFSTLVSEWTTRARLGSARDEGIYLGEVRAA